MTAKKSKFTYMKKFFFTVGFVFMATLGFAQYNYRDSNRIGITFGINQFTLTTKNFQTKPETGWNGGLSIRGNYYDNWDMVYAIQFSENNFSVNTISGFITEDIKFKLSSAQISLMASYELVENQLSFEFGPLVQVSSKLKTDSANADNKITGTDILAKDITNISRFNFYPVVGVTAGFKHFRANISYQYGINNMLGNLNNLDLGVKLKGHPGILNANLIIYL
jgi:hypothetical protein